MLHDRTFGQGSVRERKLEVATATSPSALARAFHQKHGEVRGARLGGKLPHHVRDLASMVGGMVRQMLHEVRKTDLRRADRKHPSQGFVRYLTHKFKLFSLDFRPLQLHRGRVRKCRRTK